MPKSSKSQINRRKREPSPPYNKNREIKILARGERTAKELKQLVGSDFRDFNYLREILKFEKK